MTVGLRHIAASPFLALLQGILNALLLVQLVHVDALSRVVPRGLRLLYPLGSKDGPGEDSVSLPDSVELCGSPSGADEFPKSFSRSA
jgi:hypothetical protein